MNIYKVAILGIKARDNNIGLRVTWIEVTEIIKSDPRRVAEVIVEFHFPKKGYSTEEKAIVESQAGTSPVALILHPDLKQTKNLTGNLLPDNLLFNHSIFSLNLEDIDSLCEIFDFIF